MTIDVGASAIDRALYTSAGITYVAIANPANASGKIRRVQVWANVALPGAKVGMFYVVSGSNLTCRSYASIGDVPAGRLQGFVVDLDIQIGDLIGIYLGSSGKLECSTTGGAGCYYLSGDRMGCVNTGFNSKSGWDISLYGDDYIAPAMASSVLPKLVRVGII